MSETKSDTEVRLEAVRAMYARIPAGKFAVVGVDEFDWDPEAELYLVGIYDTREEAEAIVAEREIEQEGCGIPDSYYVYEGASLLQEREAGAQPAAPATRNPP